MWNVDLRNENGEVLHTVGPVQRLTVDMKQLDDRSSDVLRFVDPYGDTVINGWQARPLLDEIRAQFSDLPTDAQAG